MFFLIKGNIIEVSVVYESSYKDKIITYNCSYNNKMDIKIRITKYSIFFICSYKYINGRLRLKGV